MIEIRDELKTIPGVKETLTMKYQRQRWLDIACKNPKAIALVRVALNRISRDANQYHIFMAMLGECTGMTVHLIIQGM